MKSDLIAADRVETGQPAAPADEVVLRAERFSFAYEGTRRPALAEIDLEVRRGEFLGIVGPTGAGKSTLLQCLCGVIPFYTHGTRSGAVYVKGREVAQYKGLHDITGVVSLVMQDPEMQLFNLHVRDELAWGLENRGVPVPEIKAAMDEAAQKFGIAHLIDRNTATLSGGEKQRVVVASTFALRPEIVLLDEPTSELDPIGTEMVFGAAGLLASQGITVVMVEHKVEELVRYAHRLAVLEEGRITALGSVREVLEGEASARLGAYRPQVFQVGLDLEARGVGVGAPPLTVEEAVALYRRLVSPTAPVGEPGGEGG
jgi:energy-coupling factor transporter ATP-binding protein EcfA2